MDFLDMVGWREAVIGLAALIGLYSVVVLVRLARLGRPPKPAAPVWKQDPAEFGEQVFKSGVEAELKDLREQLAALREEVEKLKAARAVSPQYGEALALAQQGLEAQAIAERCDISVAEAELVRALSQRSP